MSMFCRSLFVLFLLAIVLSVLLSFEDSSNSSCTSTGFLYLIDITDRERTSLNPGYTEVVRSCRKITSFFKSGVPLVTRVNESDD